MRCGDIFMGAFNAEQVMYNHFGYRTPIPNLYNAGSAGHPGGAISGGRGLYHRRHHRPRSRLQAVVAAMECGGSAFLGVAGRVTMPITRAARIRAVLSDPGHSPGKLARRVSADRAWPGAALSGQGWPARSASLGSGPPKRRDRRSMSAASSLRPAVQSARSVVRLLIVQEVSSGLGGPGWNRRVLA